MADISTASFGGDVFPSDVVSSIINSGLAGAPVFDSLTRRTTSRSSVVFASGNPSGFDWVAELAEIPAVDPADDSAVISVTKIAGLLALSNESIGDSDLNLTAEVARLIREGMAAKADTDLVYGDVANAAAPAGVFDSLTQVAEANLRASVVQAAADIMAAGGMPNVVILSPALWAAEMQRREDVPTAAGPLFGDLGIPLDVRVAATLEATDALVLDTSGCFGIIRNDYTIEASSEAPQAWAYDAVSLRVKARLALAIPAPAKHARSVAVDAGA